MSQVRLHARLSWLPWFAACAMLASCGGGSSVDVAPRNVPSSVTGRLIPAATGVVLVEYDRQGAELQRSTPTDSMGTFVLDRVPTGERIEAVAEQAGALRSPLRWAARLQAPQTALELTPLTTLFDQLIEAGMTIDQAHERITDFLDAGCGRSAALAAESGIYGEMPLAEGVRDWLLPSLGAYLTSFGNIGISATASGSQWPDLVLQRRDLLMHMCSVAQSISSQAWLDDARQAISRDLAISDTSPQLDGLPALRVSALNDLLRLVGTRMVEMQYPELASTIGVDSSAWLGREHEMTIQLMMAHIEPAATVAASSTAPAPYPVVHLGADLDGSGSIVRTLSARVDVAALSPRTVRFANSAPQERSVRVAVDDVELTDRKGVLSQILAMPVIAPDEPLWQRAWRYVVARRQHTAPITAGTFQHQPDLYLRSIGSGFCDDVAAALQWIWRDLGFDAHVVALNGHVVPEVWVGGRWEAYDPDFGVYYLNRSGVVASVDDLANDPDLLFHPTWATATAGSSSWYPAELLASIYSSKEDNFVEPWYSQPFPDPIGATFSIPPGGYLEFTDAASQIIPTIEPGDTVALSPVRLWVPPGYSGTIELPMVLVDVTGIGQVSILNTNLDVTPAGIAPAIQERYAGLPDMGIARIDIEHADGDGLVLTMIASPLLFRSSERMKIRLTGADVSRLAVSTTPSAVN